jgi:hypothetical protein
MVGITDPPATLHPSPSSPLIPISPFLTPFLVQIFLVAATSRQVFLILPLTDPERAQGDERLRSPCASALSPIRNILLGISPKKCDCPITPHYPANSKRPAPNEKCVARPPESLPA